LAALLVHNPNGLLLAVDELAGWLHGLERSGHEQERSFYLTGWSGKSSYDVDRIQRGSLHIPAVCLSVIGTIQPGVWSNYVREALGSKAGADGFLQRFQFAVWPDPLKHTRVVDQHPDHAAKNRSAELFDLLSHIDPKRIGAEASEFDKVPSLRFDANAQPYAKQWIEAHRARWRNSTDHPALVAHMIKMQKTWSAVALICHLVDWVTGVIEDGSSGIGISALEKAIGWVDYLESHARRIYGCGVAKDRSGLQVMAGKLRSGEVGDGFSEREVLKRHWAGLADHDSLDAVLLQLQAAAWIRPEKVKTKGRTKTAWRLHPRLIESAAKCSKLSPPCSDKSGERVGNGPLLPPSAACQAAKVS
jgi:putative DNA primase/helicase